MDRRARYPTGTSNSSRCNTLLSLLAVVLLALFTAPSTAENVAPQHRVPLKVYFRAFCPACQWFVSDPLLELVRNEQFRNVVDLQLYPAAGMAEVNGELVCEGGALECTGHRLEVCIMEKDKHDVVKYLGSIACIEGDESGREGDWSEKLTNCLTADERVVIDDCYKTKADELLRNMIHKHKSSSVGWMPYTIVNDKVLGSATQGVRLDELQSSVCAAYTGPAQFYPDACTKLVGAQQRVAVAVDATAAAPVVTTVVTPTAADAEAAADAQQPALEPELAIELAIKGDDDAAAAALAIATGNVRLDVYWRAFCPGCMAFIGTPLLELLRDREFRDSIDFRPVPAAGTSVDDAGQFVCSMGLIECMGHKWMSCAIELYRDDVAQQIEYLACLESKENKGKTWSSVVTRCFPGDAAKTMRTCYDTQSDALLKKHVAQREQVDVRWVPYVLVNGVPIGDAAHGIGFQQLVNDVCKGYSGPIESRPSACRPKRLRAEVDAPATATTVPIIKPCPPKKDVKATAKAKEPVDGDAPGIGARIETDKPQANAFDNHDALAAANKNGRAFDTGANARETEADAQANSVGSVLAPAALFVVVVVLALRFYSGDHKKDA